MDERHEQCDGANDLDDRRPSLVTIPDRIRVGAMLIDVVKIPGLHMLEDGRYGVYRAGSQRIEICSEIGHGLAVQTFWHETLHAIEFDRGLRLKEREIDQLANGLVTFFLDNDLV